MKGTLSNLFILAAGVAIGSAVTWRVLKVKYDQLIDEEIKSVKEYYAKHFTKGEDEADFSDETESHETVDQILEDNDYTYYNNEKGVSKMRKPIVIPPEEFGETDYETISLTYYADGVLADDMDEPVDNVDDIVGKDSLTRFGEYEDDSVFVRNDRLKCDYEILADSRNYKDVAKRVYPHEVEE